MATQPILAAAEASLTRHFGAPVRLAAPARLGGTRSRSSVLRCTLAEGPAAAPATVILKHTLGDESDHLAPDPADAGSPLGRIAAEWAGGELLASHGLARRCYGVAPDARLIVLEDLGPGSCLADHLEGPDPSAVEDALVAYAAGMGRLHAATVGREAEFLERRAALGVTPPPEPTLDRAPGGWLQEKARPLLARLEALGVGLPAGVEAELQGVQRSLEDPGPFLAFTPGDTCPDNHHVAPDGRLRFYDFEFGGFRHALLDAAYCRVPFPTCWCVNRLPEAATRAAEAAYRMALVQGCPEAGDDALFYRELARACALWSLTTLMVGADRGFDLAGALAADGRWGIATARQRHLLRLDTLATATERFGQLPALGEVARRAGALLRARWPDTEMPLYPAFRPS